MAMNNKTSDISNWYNGGSSFPVQPKQQITAPQASQIPGLGDRSEDPSASSNGRRQWIRDTDSDYVKLAKRGGQPDLLRAEQNTPGSSDARSKRHNAASYQRADWYYHDNALSDAKSTSQAKSAYGGTAAEYDPTAADDSYLNDSSYGISGAGETGVNQGSAYDRQPLSPDYGADRYNTYEQENAQSYSAAERIGSGYAGNAYADKRTAYDQEQPGSNYGDGSPLASYIDNRRAGSGYSSVSHSDYALKNKADVSMYGSNNNNATAIQPAFEGNYHHINRMKRENSSKSDMSKLLSFGYLDSKPGNNGASDKQRGQIRQGDIATEYHSKMSLRPESGTGASVMGHQSQAPGSGQPGFNIRKPLVDDRPDFLRIGGYEAVGNKQAQYGRRKASAEFQKPGDFFGTEGSYEPSSQLSATRPSFGRMKREEEQKPDFFSIGSSHPGTSAERRQEADADAEFDILNKVNGFTSLPRTTYRRQKMDPNFGILANPVRPVAK